MKLKLTVPVVIEGQEYAAGQVLILGGREGARLVSAGQAQSIAPNANGVFVVVLGASIDAE